MEELFVYALLAREGIITEDIFAERIDRLFSQNPSDEILLEIEWLNNIKKAIILIYKNMDYSNMDIPKFGKILMGELENYYLKCKNIKTFGDTMYSLWEGLPGNIQNIEPFWTFSYADDVLAYADTRRAEVLYKKAMDYYK